MLIMDGCGVVVHAGPHHVLFMADGARASHKQAAVSFLRLAASGKARAAFDTYAGEGFRHHNPHFRGDAESLIAAMDENAVKNPDKVIEFQRVVEDGDVVAVHSRVRMNGEDPGVALVHIFRFRDDFIVELWDVAEPVPKDSPNQHGMF
jgi:predicted SnoaL-like aldol condensation-catalyzing enzyme